MQLELSAVITWIIVLLTVITSVSAFGSAKLFGDLLFEPFVIKARGQWYRFITHAFVHANWPHLLVNMFVLYMFGRNVEFLLGYITRGSSVLPFLALYLGGVLFSTLPSYRKHIHNPSYKAVGASGAVSAVLFAQILMLPTKEIGFMFLPFDLPAWAVGITYLWYSWYMDKRGGDNVAHDAHFYGAIYGIVFMTILRPSLLLRLGSFQNEMGL